jgi:hypothetical protein
MWKRIALAGATLSAVGGLAIASAAPASADSGQIWYYDAGYGQFVSYGDKFYACDRKTDGYGIHVEYYVPGGTARGWVRDTNGNNGDCVYLNTNLGEERYVHLRTCTTNNGSVVSCTVWHEAWTS